MSEAGRRHADETGRLAVVLAVRSMHATLWVEAVARALMSTGFVDLSLAVLEAAPVAAARTSRQPPGRTWRAYRACDLLVGRLLCRGRPDPRAMADLGQLGRPVAAGLGGAADLVIDLSGGVARSILAGRSGPPVWWFDHDGHEPWQNAVSGCAEVIQDRPATRCRLLSLAAGSVRPDVLRGGRMATHPLFLAENRTQLLWKSIPLLVQKVREFRDTGVVRHEPGDLPEPALVQAAGSADASALSLLARHVARSVGFIVRRLLWRGQWYLLMQSDGKHDGLDGGRTDAGRRVNDFRPDRAVVPQADRFWADPHLVPGGDGRCLLVEEYLYSTRRGRIAMLRLTEGGDVAEVRTVLELDCHLSYPAVFEHDGALFMVPESSELGRVDAYRCTSYPWRWELEATLLAGVRACDSTVIEHGGVWWLFATVSEQPWLTPRDSLHVFFADDPLKGTWRAHPGNPVLCDTYGSRPAGRPFVVEGRLYRPSQDCSKGYGCGIRIKEVTTLTKTGYEERDVSLLEPHWRSDVVATHTLAVGESRTIVDVMRWLPRVPLSSWVAQRDGTVARRVPGQPRIVRRYPRQG